MHACAAVVTYRLQIVAELTVFGEMTSSAACPVAVSACSLDADQFIDDDNGEENMEVAELLVQSIKDCSKTLMH